MNYQTLRVRYQNKVGYIQFHRPDANNTINSILVEELTYVLRKCEEAMTVVVLEGLPEVFCLGADFHDIHHDGNETAHDHDPEPLYNLWLQLTKGSYITISHVRGRANAGGVGFVAASDIVIADHTAQFSLSELLFGLYPACVLPFLIRRIGFQKAHYLTLMTQPILVQQAHEWGLVDAYDEKSESLLRKHLLRLQRLPKTGITRYKPYMSQLYRNIYDSKYRAIAANKEMFSDQQIFKWITRYVEEGKFPWDV